MTDVLNFDKIEKLREHMLISRTHLAELLGVSRVQYWKWVKSYRAGTPMEIRTVNRVRIRDILTGMLRVMQEHKWPSGEAANLPPSERYEILKRHLILSELLEP